MALRPTNVPLTVKEFEEAKCGVCAGCGCYCGYIAYLKGNELVDLYGHPHDPNGIGSLCTKGISLIQELQKNPLRLTEALIREGDSFRAIPQKDVKKVFKDLAGGRVGVFLDRMSDLADYLSAKKFGTQVFSESIYLPFRASTLRPQEWREQKVILALECEPVFSEVMSTRWLVDAFERSAYIVSVSSRYGTTSAKARKRILVKPPLVVKFLQELADILEGACGNGLFSEDTEELAKLFTKISESLILVGETLLRSPWKGNVLNSLARIRKRTKVNYAIVGNITPFEEGSLEEFLKELESFDTLILTGNPAIFLSDEKLKLLKKKKVIYLGIFPNLTANCSSLIIPAKVFTERPFLAFRNGFGIFAYSPKVLSTWKKLFTISELLGGVGKEELDRALRILGLSFELVKEKEGGAPANMPFIEEINQEWEEGEVVDEGLYLMCENTLVDEIGHWNVWTHEIERHQAVHVNPETAQKLGIGDELSIKGEKLKVVRSSNIATDVLFVPNSFEETQPFDPGVRVGKLLNNPALRVERYD